ncbi:hypothetical protein [Botrimarina hoheduenensis]|uniref:PEP-CTERM protein-sorting domain-containing protein n=1 Tax=Botrimarina hoheduenensis TaxID=2528000 RepID=A0A5C5VQ82_9BACT|nr:hypothetical protein [Botrimarina hoheduenensis]TWT40786.1 hypothetical protein Pla111_32040 [Botrimarina hoheduenensis]
MAASKKSLSRLLIACLLQAVVVSASAAPVIEGIYLQGKFLPGASLLPGFDAGTGVFPNLGDIVRSNGQRDLLALPNGAFATPVNTGDTGNNTGSAGVFYLFGTQQAKGLNPVALRREATLSGLQQITLGSAAALDYAGNVAYSASIPNPGAGPSRLSSLWVNDTVQWTEGDAIPSGPLAGLFYDSPGGLYRSPSGVTSWVSNYTTTALGTNTGTALMRGLATNDVLLRSGDTIAGLGTIGVHPSSSTVSGNIVWSALGTNYLTSVSIPNGGVDNFGDPTFDDAPVVNGSALTLLSGAILKENLTIPAIDGGLPGEFFKGFQGFDVNEAGEWAVGAFTDTGGAGQDDVLIVNGQIAYREGQIVDGVTLTGQIQGVGLNDRGDLAFAWNDTLFINGLKIAGLGTPVDTDGDGLADATLGGTGLALNRFEITNLTAAGGDNLPVVYVAGEAVGVPGVPGTVDTFFRLKPATSITGDYNFDGVVDVADYTVWRDSLGSAVLLDADGDGDHVIDQDDYALWAASFGNVASLAIPEPASAFLLLTGCLIAARPANRREAAC